MSLNRLMFAAGAVVVAGVLAPAIAPGFLRSVVAPSGGGGEVARVGEPAAPLPARIEAPVDAPRHVDPPAHRSVALHADAQGQYEATASINGQTVAVVVDTGATTVALSAETARRLGVMPPQSDFRIAISTANGPLAAAPVMLNQISIGGIVVRNVQAIVVPAGALSVNLLGMTYLSRLSKFEVASGQLTLRE